MIPGLLIVYMILGVYLCILANNARKMRDYYTRAVQDMHNERLRQAYRVPDALIAMLKADTEDAV